MMWEDVLTLAEGVPCNRAALAELAVRLPRSEAELYDLIETAIAQERSWALTAITAIATDFGRPIAAQHLARGAHLIASVHFLGYVAMRAKGNVADALLSSVRTCRCSPLQDTSRLFFAAYWAKRVAQPESPLPEGFFDELRFYVRGDIVQVFAPWLVAIADLADDEVLEDFVETVPPFIIDDAREGIHKTISITMAGLDEVLERAQAPGYFPDEQVRRLTKKVGRNEPCPCGSGKKYKKCCLVREKAGSAAVPAPHVAAPRLRPLTSAPRKLTEHDIWQMSASELWLLSVAGLDEELLPVYINSVNILQEDGLLLPLWEHWGWAEDRDDYFIESLDVAVSQKRDDIFDALWAMRQKCTSDETDLSLRVRLALHRDTPARCLELIEAACRDELDSSGAETAFSLLDSKYPGLGILVARGAVGCSKWLDESELLLTEIEESRLDLGLPVADASHDLMELLCSLEELSENNAVEDTSDVDEASEARIAELERKLAESKDRLARVNDALAEQERNIEELSQRADEKAERVQAQRAKAERMKEEVTRLQTACAERDALLARTHNELARARKAQQPRRPMPVARAVESGNERDENVVEDEVMAESCVVRIPQFPPGFAKKLASLPSNRAAAAMSLIGELCAGRRRAFGKVKRLKQDRQVWRASVGQDHRLLFSCQGTELVVHDIILRRDLERWIERWLKQ